MERAAIAANVHVTYQSDLLPPDRRVCVPRGSVELGTLFDVWLEGLRLRLVPVGEDRIVLVPLPVAPPGIASLALAPSLAELERVVVRTDETVVAPLERSTISRTVITSQDLQSVGAGSFAEAMSAVAPGLWMWTPAGANLVGGAWLRGASSFGASAPKVYVDGIEVANPAFVGQLGADEIAEVEVIRGPQGGARFGAGATAGVIRITTRVASSGAGAQGLSARSMAGLVESAYAPLGVVSQDHGVAGRLGAGARSAAFSLSTSSLGAYVPGATNRQVHVSTGAALLGRRSRFQVLGRFDAARIANVASPLLADVVAAQTSQAGGLAAPEAGDGAALGLSQYTLGGTWAIQLPRWTNTFVVGSDGYRLTNVDAALAPVRAPGDSALAAAAGGADRMSARWSGTALYGTRGKTLARLTLGADHSALRDASTGAQRVDDAALGTVWRYTSGATADGELTLGTSLAFTGSLRFERNDGFTVLSGASALPSLGVAYRRSFGIAAVTLRSAFGRAISPPRLDTRFGQYGPRAPTLLTLEPEQQSGVEFGIDVAVGSRLAAHLTRYDQLASNLVQPVAGTNPDLRRGYSYRLENVGAIANRGWELEGSGTLGALTVSGALSWTDSRVNNVALGYTGDLKRGDRILQVPAKTASLSAAWNVPGWSISGTLSRASDWINYDWILLSTDLSDPGRTPPQGSALRSYWRKYDGVTRLFGTLSKDLSSSLAFLISGENLLNAQLGELDNVTVVPGRTIRAGLRAKFTP